MHTPSRALGRARSGARLARITTVRAASAWLPALCAVLATAGACRRDRSRGTPRAADAGVFAPTGEAPPAVPPATPPAVPPATPPAVPPVVPPGAEALHQAAQRSPIKSDEDVLFFPTVGRLARDGDREVWKLPVHGWIYEPEVDDLLRESFVRSLKQSLGADPQQLDSAVLEERLRGFLFDNERDKRIEVEVAGQVFALPATQADGHFEDVLSLPADMARAAARDGRLTIRAITRPDDHRRLTGEIFLMAPGGLLVISDIDDTVKITEVRNRKAMLANTFLQPFRAVPGMTELYTGWIDRAAGDHLHFVSSSPWQLYSALRAMFDQAAFPAASVSLKRIRLKDRSVTVLFADPRETKPKAISALLEASPGRPVILVGDSGELDPEVYGEVARRHPERIKYIAIRDVTTESAGAPRYRKAFEGVPAERWQIFREPAELPDRAGLDALVNAPRP
jgi:phosphatidate phosphatase APP1